MNISFAAELPSHALTPDVGRATARQRTPHRFVRLTLFVTALAIGGFAGAANAQMNATVMLATGPLTKQTMSRLLLTDVARSGNRTVAVGDRGYVVYSDDNGNSWSRAKTPAGLALLNGVYFSDANTVWAVGHDSVILKSTDQGKEWAQAYASAKDQSPLMDIIFNDANQGFAVGAYGTFLETTDAGKSWTARKVIPSAEKPAKPIAPAGRGNRAKAADLDDDIGKSPDEDKHLNAIVALGAGKLFIAGEAGTLLLSNDAGKSWARVASPYKGSFFGAVQANDGSVLVLGLRGNVFRSPDASLKSWEVVATNTKASMMGATKLADGSIVLSGLSGTMLISRNNGKTFSALSSGTIRPLSAAVPGAANSLIVVGETGAREVSISVAANSEAKK